MRLNATTKQTLGYLMGVAVPEVNYFDIVGDGTVVQMQAKTQAEVAAVRTAFGPGITWAKQYNMALEWWEYVGVVEAPHAAVTVRIYAVSEAPPACQAVTEEYEVEEDVPTSYERKTVTRTRIRYVCPDASPSTATEPASS